MKDWVYDRIRIRMLFIIVAALGCLSAMVDARAGTVTTIVKPPTLYTDGTKIEAPIKYRLEGNYDGQPTITVMSDSPTFKLTDMAPGHWCNRVYATVDNVDADPTDTVCATVPQPSQPPPVKKKPNPAYGITSTATP